MIDTVTKRSGETVKFNPKKIYKAIAGANKDCGNIMTKSDISNVTLRVNVALADRSTASVEEIQDIVEHELMVNQNYDVAKAYVIYREKHRQQREASQHLMESYDDLLFKDSRDMDLKRDNANINTDAPMGIMLKLGTEGAKTYVDNYNLPEEAAEADREKIIHIHKLIVA